MRTSPTSAPPPRSASKSLPTASSLASNAKVLPHTPTVAHSTLLFFLAVRCSRCDGGGRAGAKNVDLGKATAGLPEYLQKKAHLSMHFSLTNTIFQEIKARDLNQLGSIEQALVFDEKKSGDLQRLMSQWNLKQCALPPFSGASLHALPYCSGTSCYG